MADIKTVPANKYKLVSAKILLTSSVSLSVKPIFFKSLIAASMCKNNLNLPSEIGEKITVKFELGVIFIKSLCLRYKKFVVKMGKNLFSGVVL